jgi:hypothetical protein
MVGWDPRDGGLLPLLSTMEIILDGNFVVPRWEAQGMVVLDRFRDWKIRSDTTASIAAAR